ncbi:GNAT family N-acetyltransferase [Gandjariella thermophila]|uniref:N-acetyltransferase n=1 Tax=Gandjariella thermophila TaxID=1931992 RepID=A0A4D4JAD7_9PSEU|nr:GNAT family N-acetyltransferase [Gandjariella thermophila]GDY31369.1 N-acetyltransferase [Gandjariella thermophila]
MEPVEINAGAYYLRQLRADDLLDDRPAIVAAFADPETRRWVTGYQIADLAAAGRYVALRAREWADDERYSWAIAEPVSGALLGEVGLKELDLSAGEAEVACWTHPEYRGKGIMAEALQAVLRFGFHGLDLRQVDYRHAEGNEASRRVAEKSGFSWVGTIPDGAMAADGRRDLLVWRLVRAG